MSRSVVTGALGISDPAAAPVETPWSDCSFLSCSVLPVSRACNCECSFCFSGSSISTLRLDAMRWSEDAVVDHYVWARGRGATRLVITGGGEPLLRPDAVVDLVRWGALVFDEIALFTNGSLLTRQLADRLADAGLSYLCWSRHAAGDADNRQLMGPAAPTERDFLASAGDLPVRATCVMARGFVETTRDVWDYIERFTPAVTQFTFKHTYVAYERSIYRDSPQDRWAAEHQIEADPFAGQGIVLARLPWGPEIKRIEEVQVCHYYEPTPAWERENRLCRSSNLLSDGSVYASLEDEQSLLYRLPT